MQNFTLTCPFCIPDVLRSKEWHYKKIVYFYLGIYAIKEDVKTHEIKIKQNRSFAPPPQYEIKFFFFKKHLFGNIWSKLKKKKLSVFIVSQQNQEEILSFNSMKWAFEGGDWKQFLVLDIWSQRSPDLEIWSRDLILEMIRKGEYIRSPGFYNK